MSQLPQPRRGRANGQLVGHQASDAKLRFRLVANSGGGGAIVGWVGVGGAGGDGGARLSDDALICDDGEAAVAIP